AEREARADLPTFFRFMLPAELLALLCVALTLLVKPAALPVMAVFVVAWMLSPVVAQRISSLRPQQRKQLEPRDIALARAVCRRTWRFFEEFVGNDDNWLPPDNFQEDPAAVIAHRTSPTNIGLL